MASLTDLVNLYLLPTGRRIIAIRALAEAADQEGKSDLAAIAREAVEEDLKTRALELRWARDKDPTKGDEAVELDRSIDTLVSGMWSVTTGVITSALPGQPIKEATIVRDKFFPGGLNALVNQTHEAQSTAVDVLVKDASEPGQLKDSLAALKLTEVVAEIARLNKQLGAVLAKAPIPRVDFPTVQAAQSAGQDRMLELVARVLGAYPKQTSEHAAARGRLLAGILAQQEELRAARRLQKILPDVNPDTGKPEAHPA